MLAFGEIFWYSINTMYHLVLCQQSGLFHAKVQVSKVHKQHNLDMERS